MSDQTHTPRRERVTWIRWDTRRKSMVTSHPYQWRVDGNDGATRYFGTRDEAMEHHATGAER